MRRGERRSVTALVLAVLTFSLVGNPVLASAVPKSSPPKSTSSHKGTSQGPRRVHHPNHQDHASALKPTDTCTPKHVRKNAKVTPEVPSAASRSGKPARYSGCLVLDAAPASGPKVGAGPAVGRALTQGSGVAVWGDVAFPQGCGPGYSTPSRTVTCVHELGAYLVFNLTTGAVVGRQALEVWEYWETQLDIMSMEHGFQVALREQSGWYQGGGASVVLTNPCEAGIVNPDTGASCWAFKLTAETPAVGLPAETFAAMKWEEYIGLGSQGKVDVDSVAPGDILSLAVPPTVPQGPMVPADPIALYRPSAWRCDNITGGRNTEGCVDPLYAPTIVFDAVRKPKLLPVAQHMQDALDSGLPGAPGTVPLTRSTDPAVEAANRVNSGCAGLGVTLPNTCDEYPFATSLEGGSGASIRVVPSTANNSQGGILTQGYRSWRILDADKYFVRVVLDNPDVAEGNWLPSAYSEYFGYGYIADAGVYTGPAELRETGSVPLPVGAQGISFLVAEPNPDGDPMDAADGSYETPTAWAIRYRTWGSGSYAAHGSENLPVTAAGDQYLPADAHLYVFAYALGWSSSDPEGYSPPDVPPAQLVPTGYVTGATGPVPPDIAAGHWSALQAGGTETRTAVIDRANQCSLAASSISYPGDTTSELLRLRNVALQGSVISPYDYRCGSGGGFRYYSERWWPGTSVDNSVVFNQAGFSLTAPLWMDTSDVIPFQDQNEGIDYSAIPGSSVPAQYEWYSAPTATVQHWPTSISVDVASQLHNDSTNLNPNPALFENYSYVATNVLLVPCEEQASGWTPAGAGQLVTVLNPPQGVIDDSTVDTYLTEQSTSVGTLAIPPLATAGKLCFQEQSQAMTNYLPVVAQVGNMDFQGNDDGDLERQEASMSVQPNADVQVVVQMPSWRYWVPGS